MICTFIVILFHHSKLLKDTPYATGDETDLDNNNPDASGGNNGIDAGDDSNTNNYDQNDPKLNDTNEPNLINNINDNANKMIIMDVSDCEKDKATDGDDEATTTTMSPTKYKDDKDSDSAKIRQTAVLVESDGFVTKNGHRVVIQSQQHSRSPSTTSRSADV